MSGQALLSMPARDWPARLGLALRRRRKLVAAAQWTMVFVYLLLVTIPAFLPLPSESAHLWNHVTRFAQFVFWGLWWPFVVLSVMLLGRAWCGLLCPEGALTEWVSRHGLGYGIPRWMKWGGWAFVAFAGTTVFGQMTSVYEYPKPALLVLGGSTLAAAAVGFVYARGKRAWCRHLCPVSGVFGLLARIAPLHFKVDAAAWDSAPAGQRASRQHAVNCAPLLDIRRMRSASACHMCGRCAGERDAVALALRSPETELLAAPALASRERVRQPELWPARLLVFGMLGLALGAFQWSASPWLVAAKQALAEALLNCGIEWPLGPVGHWWLFTDYPEANDVFTWLDGGLLLAYLAAESLAVGGWAWGWLRLAGAIGGLPWERLAYALIPFAGTDVFVGLTLLTTGQLSAEGILLPWANPVRMALLCIAALWGATLAWRLAERNRAATALAVTLAAALPLSAWGVQFLRW